MGWSTAGTTPTTQPLPATPSSHCPNPHPPSFTDKVRDMDVAWQLEPLYNPRDAGEVVSHCLEGCVCWFGRAWVGLLRASDGWGWLGGLETSRATHPCLFTSLVSVPPIFTLTPLSLPPPNPHLPPTPHPPQDPRRRRPEEVPPPRRHRQGRLVLLRRPRPQAQAHGARPDPLRRAAVGARGPGGGVARRDEGDQQVGFWFGLVWSGFVGSWSYWGLVARGGEVHA